MYLIEEQKCLLGMLSSGEVCWTVLGDLGTSSCDRASSNFRRPAKTVWELLEPHERSWGLLELRGPPEASWGLLWSSGASWGVLRPPGASWGLLGRPGGSWGVLAALGASWGLLGSPGAF